VGLKLCLNKKLWGFKLNEQKYCTWIPHTWEARQLLLYPAFSLSSSPGGSNWLIPHRGRSMSWWWVSMNHGCRSDQQCPFTILSFYYYYNIFFCPHAHSLQLPATEVFGQSRHSHSLRIWNHICALDFKFEIKYKILLSECNCIGACVCVHAWVCVCVCVCAFSSSHCEAVGRSW